MPDNSDDQYDKRFTLIVIVSIVCLTAIEIAKVLAG